MAHFIHKTILSVFFILFIPFFIFSCNDHQQLNKRISKLIVYKKRKVMEAYVNDEIEKTYSISLGGNSVGKKTGQGDKKTPEGTYYTNSKNANSKYHKNLGISYPNSNDVAYAKKAGLSPGGDIKIHGLPNGMEFVGGLHKMFDWTAGCIAVNNSEIDELYELVAIGTVIVIKP